MSQHPPHHHHQQQKPNRKRFLNVIYFVDSNKTKTFKLSLRTSYVAVSLLIFTVFWSLFSTVLLIRSYQGTSSQSQRIRGLLATIFTYQTRYDRVYEKSYPNNDSLIAEALKESQKDKEKNEPEEEASVISLAAKTPPAKEQTKESKTKSKPAKVASSSSASSPEEEIEIARVKLDKFSVATRNNKLNLKFAVKNISRPEKANGYVIGFATFVDLEGNKIVVTSPSGIKEGESINKWALPRQHRFSIRYYTQKTLEFDLPHKKGGTFQSIKIIVGSKNNDPLEFVYNIKGTEGAFAPEASTPKQKVRNEQSAPDSNKVPSPVDSNRDQ